MVWYKAKKDAEEQSNNTGKMMEHTLMETHSKHIKDKKVIRSVQHGSGDDQLIAFYGEITDKGRGVDACLS